MRFDELHLIDPLLRAVSEEGYVEATPIQSQAIPHVLAGKDLLGLAQTGTGKTAAFALPILQRLEEAHPGGEGRRAIRVLIITPTRELASQIGESFTAYGRHLRFRNTVIFGGVGQRPQEDALRRGVDILIATPGRFLDLSQQGFIKLDQLSIFVLDEADRMLDMGFIPDVRRIVALLPKVRQSLFFSATMPPEAQRLADALLKNPAKIAVTPPATTVEKVDQGIYFVAKEGKRNLLVTLLHDPSFTRALVFTRTKHGANKVVQILVRAGFAAEAIHGNKSQSARERALEGFKTGRVRVLVATDIAARGIDVDQISHVINFDLPNVPEQYVHRIGRTARAGASGIAVSFCDHEERAYLADIERIIRRRIPVLNPPTSRTPFSERAPQLGSEPDSGDRPRTPDPIAPPVRIATDTPAGTEPGWARYSYRSTAAPARPAGGGGHRGGGHRSGGGGRPGGGGGRSGGGRSGGGGRRGGGRHGR